MRVNFAYAMDQAACSIPRLTGPAAQWGRAPAVHEHEDTERTPRGFPQQLGFTGAAGGAPNISQKRFGRAAAANRHATWPANARGAVQPPRTWRGSGRRPW